MGLAPFKSPVARSVPFDNSTNGMVSTDAQAAIEEVRNGLGSTFSTILEQFDDFITGATTSQMGWAVNTSGGSAGATLVETAPYISHLNFGVIQIKSSTAVSGRTVLYVLPCMRLGNCKVTFETNIYLDDLGGILGTDYQLHVGLCDQYNTNNDQQDGVYFEYQSTTSANWRICTASNNTRTKTTTTVPVVADQYIKLKLIVNTAGTNVDFYINGTLAGSITTNIPTAAGFNVGPYFRIRNTLLSTVRSAYIDYVYTRMDFGASR